jgi:hypothetical protein
MSSNPHAARRSCPDCDAGQFKLRQDSHLFFAVCSGCGKRGPEAASVYEAVMAWRSVEGEPSPTMERQVLRIGTVLVLLAVSLAIIGFVLA